MGYVLLDKNRPIGLLRYNFFCDNMPFCTLLYVDPEHQHKGYGREYMKFWEDEMKSLDYRIMMTSTQVDEGAQHFYRKLGYKDSGGLIMSVPGFEQPMELFFVKAI